MEEELKKIDLGEFSCIIRDFQIALPKSKISDLFKKASVNCGSLEVPEFKGAMRAMGKEYTKAKLRENRERLILVKKVIQDLKIPEEYPNRERT
jgi:Ca2+-binding EF-hand superfamily protein